MVDHVERRSGTSIRRKGMHIGWGTYFKVGIVP